MKMPLNIISYANTENIIVPKEEPDPNPKLPSWLSSL